tara:strand:+ start:2780 stop:2968 length:189 start_codon:yes stop_codon:yes gene_type:complete
MCGKCKKACGALLLIGGILFLLQDLNIWNFWGISWYTFVLILVGGSKLCHKKCPDCQAPVKK